MTTLVVGAHPDDETLHAGAFIAHATRRGEQVITLTLTRGEAGRTLGICHASELRSVRIAEYYAAVAVLGVVHAEVRSLPDGTLLRHMAETTAVIRSIIDRWQPQTVVTFPPNGLNGHPDHRAVHQAVCEALDSTRTQHPGLLLMTETAESTEPARPGFLAPEEVNRSRLPVTMIVRDENASERKLAALGCYDTQSRSITKRMRLRPAFVMAETFSEWASAFQHGIGSSEPINPRN